MTFALSNDPAWLKAAFADLGLHEKVGPGSNPRVVQMYAEAGNPGIKDDAVAWCAAAVGSWLYRANLKGTNSLAARSYLNYGKKLSLTNIPRGAILVFRRGNSDWQGHVCFCLRDDGDYVQALGGNQSDQVSIVRFSKAALLAARWPETALNSATLQSGGASLFGAVSQEPVGGAAEHIDANSDSIAASLGWATDTVQQYATYLKIAQYALIALSIAAAGYAAYRFIQKRIRPTELPEIDDGPSIEFDEPVKKRAKRKPAKKKRAA